MITFCTFVFCLVVIWFIAKDHTQELQDKHHDNNDWEPHLTREQWRVERYMRHKEKYKSRRRM